MYINAYIWNLERWVPMNVRARQQSRHRQTFGLRRTGECGMI